VALGVTTHLGITPPVLGGDTIVKILTEKVAELTGGRFIVEILPEKAAESLKEIISIKRKGLGL
jgi:carbon-monoxide dehydrogenase catalytic subunit